MSTDGAAEATTSGATVTPSGTANTKGAWSQLTGSLTRDCQALLVMVNPASALIDGLVDIATGAAGSEQAFLHDIPAPRHGSSPMWYPYLFPVSLAGGVRVSARAQLSTASTSALAVILHGISEGFQSPSGLSRVATLGSIAATTSIGATLPSLGVNTKTAWTQIGTTVSACQALLVSLSTFAGASGAAPTVMFDIGIGAAGSEQPILTDVALGNTGAASVVIMTNLLLPIALPAGTRVSVRAQGGSTTVAMTVRANAFAIS